MFSQYAKAAARRGRNYVCALAKPIRAAVVGRAYRGTSGYQVISALVSPHKSLDIGDTRDHTLARVRGL